MPGDVDQRRFRHRRRRGHHFGREQEGERAGAADEAAPDHAHHRLAGNAEGERDPGLGGDDPEADLPHLLGHRLPVALGELLGDDRGEDRIEAGLQLLRKRGDLLARHNRRRPQ